MFISYSTQPFDQRTENSNQGAQTVIHNSTVVDLTTDSPPDYVKVIETDESPPDYNTINHI